MLEIVQLLSLINEPESDYHDFKEKWYKKTNYIKSSEKQNQNSECFEMRDNNCNK